MHQLSPTASSPLGAPRVLAQGATGTLLLSRSDVERLLSSRRRTSPQPPPFANRRALKDDEGARFSFNA